MQDNPLIETKELTYIYSPGTTYEKAAVKNVSMSIKKGEFIGIIGHTGSGKSTLIQHFNALLRPWSGQVLLEGQDINAQKQNLPQLRRRVGLVFQYPEHQLFEVNVFKDIAFGLAPQKLSESETAARVTEALAAVGLSDKYLDKSPFELSGGERRRVAIAGVMVTRPQALVLDEPAAGLDPKGRREILATIKQAHTERAGELTVVLVSHSMEDIAKYADRVLVMKDGEIALTGTPYEVFANAERLTEIGLGLPQVTRLVRELNASGAGFALNEGIFEVTQAHRAIMESL